jgi:hypothetical protein
MKVLRSVIGLAIIVLAGCGGHDEDPLSPSCSYAATANRLTFDADGGNGSMSLTTECAWSVTSEATWLTLAGPTTGKGGATIGFVVAPNPGAISRTARIAFPNGSLSIVQSGRSCTYVVAPDVLRFDLSGGTRTVQLTTSDGCAWTATSSQSWIRITRSPAGAGPATIDITVDQYASAPSRTGVVTVGGRTITVTQDGTGCPVSIEPLTVSIGAEGGTRSFNVNAAAACSWTAHSQNVWIAVVENGLGSGAQSVSFQVSPNTAIEERVGRITVADQTLYITQAAAAGP